MAATKRCTLRPPLRSMQARPIHGEGLNVWPVLGRDRRREACFSRRFSALARHRAAKASTSGTRYRRSVAPSSTRTSFTHETKAMSWDLSESSTIGSANSSADHNPCALVMVFQ